MSFEGGYLFDGSSSNVQFDPDDDKLGNLDFLKPGDDGAQFRFELGQVYDLGWDYKLALGAIVLGNDKTSSDYDIDVPFFPDIVGSATGKQDLSIGIADLEMGFRPDMNAGGLDLRVFGGVRAIKTTNEGQWLASDNYGDKVGSYEDEVWAVGPRIGLDATMPIEDQHQIALVGSVSGAVLFGKRSTDEGLGTVIGSGGNSFSELETVWNLDAMAGLQVPIGERAAFTFGYKAQKFWNLVAGRSDVETFLGDYDSDGSKDVLVHGPFLNLTVEIP